MKERRVLVPYEKEEYPWDHEFMWRDEVFCPMCEEWHKKDEPLYCQMTSGYLYGDRNHVR